MDKGIDIGRPRFITKHWCSSHILQFTFLNDPYVISWTINWCKVISLPGKMFWKRSEKFVNVDKLQYERQSKSGAVSEKSRPYFLILNIPFKKKNSTFSEPFSIHVWRIRISLNRKSMIYVSSKKWQFHFQSVGGHNTFQDLEFCANSIQHSDTFSTFYTVMKLTWSSPLRILVDKYT